MAYRFVHTADLHLDSPLRSLALRNADLADLVSDASRPAPDSRAGSQRRSESNQRAPMMSPIFQLTR